MHLASQLKVNQLLAVSQEKHDALWLTFGVNGHMVSCWMVVVLDVLGVCLATMGPTLGANFLSQVFLSLHKEILSTGPTGVKILTCWMLIYVVISLSSMRI